MKKFTCDDCYLQIGKERRNKVTITNRFNHPVTFHYCAPCAEKRWPGLKSMIGWTRPEPRA